MVLLVLISIGFLYLFLYPLEEDICLDESLSYSVFRRSLTRLNRIRIWTHIWSSEFHTLCVSHIDSLPQIARTPVTDWNTKLFLFQNWIVDLKPIAWFNNPSPQSHRFWSNPPITDHKVCPRITDPFQVISFNRSLQFYLILFKKIKLFYGFRPSLVSTQITLYNVIHGMRHSSAPMFPVVGFFTRFFQCF